MIERDSGPDSPDGRGTPARARELPQHQETQEKPDTMRLLPAASALALSAMAVTAAGPAAAQADDITRALDILLTGV